MTERVITIKITSDGRAFVADQQVNAKAAKALGEQLDRIGISAKQQAAALRGIPAQFTDIFTSIAAGQSPMTVFLQQGGQLKDMFGGAGPAARALGGYVMGLVNPFTLAAGAVGVLGYAYIKGAGEATGYSTALIMSGNAAGTTAAAMQVMASNIDGVIGTQAKAAEGLAAFAASGAVAGSSLENFTRIAVQMEQATGQAVEETVKQFEALANEPLKATIKLNEKYNYLTDAVYQQIKALELQGKTTEAAQVAQDAFANATDVRTKQILANLGLIEQGWRGIKNGVKEAIDAMLGIGRAEVVGEKIKRIKDEITGLELVVQKSSFLKNREGKINVEALQAKREELAAAQEVERLALRSAQAQAAGNEQVKARIAFDQDGVKFLSDKVKLERDIVKARNEGLAAGASEVEIAKRVKDIQASYAKKGGSNKDDQALARAVATEAAGIKAGYELAKAATKDGLDAIASARQQGLLSEQAAITQASALRLQDIDSQRQALQAELAVVKKRKDSGKEQAELMGKLAVLEQSRTNEQRKAARDIDELLVKPQLALVASTLKTVEALEAQAYALEQQNAVFGKGEAALLDLTIAQLEKSKADLQATDSVIPGYIEALEKQIDAVKKLRAAQANKEDLTAHKKARDDAQDEEKRAAKKLADELEKTAERWTGELRKGVKSFRKFLVDELKREVIRVAIQPVLTQAIGSLFSGGSGGSGGILGSLANSLLGSSGSGLGSIFGSGGGLVNNIVSGVSGALGLGAATGAFAASAGTAATVSAASAASLGGIGFTGAATGGIGFTGAATGGIGLAGSTAAAAGTGGLAGAAGSAAATGGAAAAAGGTGLSAALAAVPVWGWVALGAALLLGSGGGETRSGQQLSGLDAKFMGGPSGGSIAGDAYTQTYQATTASINDTFRVLGSSATLGYFAAGIESSKNGKGFAYAGGVVTNNGQSTGFGQYENGYLNRRGSMTAEQAAAAGVEEFQQAYLQALQAASGQLGRKEAVSTTSDVEITQGEAQSFLTKVTTTTMQQMMSDAEIAAAEAASDIPKTSRDLLRGIDVDALAKPALDALINKLQSGIANVEGLKQVAAALPFENLKNLSFDAAAGLVGLADALDKVDGNGLATLSSGLQNFFTNFFSPEEQRTNTANNIATSLQAAGGTVTGAGLLGMSRVDYRKMVEEYAKRTDEVGKKFYVALLNMSGAFASIVPAAQEVATVVDEVALKLAADIKAFRDRVGTTGAPGLASLSDDIIKSLMTLSGGLDGFLNNLNTYESNFLTPAEQREIKVRNITNSLNAAGVSITADNVRNASRDQYRTAVSAAQANINAPGGAAAYAALLAVAGDFAAITPEVDAVAIAAAAAADAAQRLADALREQAEAAERARQAAARNTDAAVQAAKRAINAERERVTLTQQLAQESVQALEAMVDTLRSNARELLGQSDKGRGLLASQGVDFIQQAIAQAQGGGYMPDSKALNEAIGAARSGIDTANFGSQLDYDRARLQLAVKLSTLGGLATNQLTTAEQQLEAANAQLKYLKDLDDGIDKMVATMQGVDTSVLTIAQAIDRVAEALTRQTGFHVKPAGGSGAASSPANAGSPFTVGGGGTPTASGSTSVSSTGFLITQSGIPLDFRGVANANLDDPQKLAEMVKNYKLSVDDVVALMGYDKTMGRGYVEGYFAQHGIQAFARGGLGMGLAMVGEEGAELVDFRTPGRIYSAGNTQDMLQGAGASTGAQMQQMWDFMRAMPVQSSKALYLLDRIEKIIDRWDIDGLAIKNLEGEVLAVSL